MESLQKAKNFVQYYNEGAFWQKISFIAKTAGLKLIYISLLLYYTLSSSNVSKMDRALIIGSLGYFIFPLDIIPDYIPFVGYTDDLTILLCAYRRVSANLNDDIRNKAKNKLSAFFGDYNSSEIDGY